MGVLSYLAPALFMAAGGVTMGVACGAAVMRGNWHVSTLSAAGSSAICWALQAFLWVQIGRGAL